MRIASDSTRSASFSSQLSINSYGSNHDRFTRDTIGADQFTLGPCGDTELRLSESVSEVTIAKFSKSVSESESVELNFSDSESELIEKNFSELKPESTPPRNP